MVTINDIARQAGVAKSTVSRYLNNGSISPKTKEKIDRIVEETGYKPNAFARSLKAQRTNMLGVIIPRLNSPSTNEMLVGVDRTARQEGYQLIITNSDQDNARELENIRALAKQKVEGIIISGREVTEEHLAIINNIEIPVLFIGQKVEGIHSIIHADYDAGKKIADYALSLGHRHFLFVGVSEKDEAVGVQRKKGFLDQINAHEEAQVEMIESSFSRTKTYQKALEFLPNNQATYIACATDNIAVAVMKAANELGYSIPNDFSLSGFGGYEATSYVHPTITTVSYPFRELGEQALHNLKAIIDEEEVPMEMILDNELTIKDSTISC